MQLVLFAAIVVKYPTSKQAQTLQADSSITNTTHAKYHNSWAFPTLVI